MCTIIYKPAGFARPTDEVINNCWNSNQHGAGWMYNDGKQVVYSKGYTKLKEFKAAIDKLDPKYEWGLHFRIATHGGVNQPCTHPFPVVESIDEMKKLEGIAETMLMHNGVMHYNGGSDYSDSMEFAQLVAALNINPFLREEQGELHDKAIRALAGDNQRLMFMNAHEVVLFGDWKEDSGYWYSNSDYKYSHTSYACGYGGVWGGYQPTALTCEICETTSIGVEYDEDYQMCLCWRCGHEMDKRCEEASKETEAAIEGDNPENAKGKTQEIDYIHSTCTECQRGFVRRTDECEAYGNDLCSVCLEEHDPFEHVCSICGEEFLRSKAGETIHGRMYCRACISHWFSDNMSSPLEDESKEMAITTLNDDSSSVQSMKEALRVIHSVEQGEEIPSYAG